MQHVAIPECFQRITATRSDDYRFEDLKNHQFTKYEKDFLAAELLGFHSLLTPTKILNNGIERWTAQGFAQRHNICHQKIDLWKKNLSSGKGNKEGPGCYTALDDVGKENICKRINDGNSSTCSLLISDLRPVIENERKETRKRRGAAVQAEEEITVSTSYVQKFRCMNNIQARSAQDLTPARLKALLDIRMSYRIACMYEAFSGHLPATHKWNADATTMVVHKPGQGSNVCYIPGPDALKKLDSSVVTNDLALLVKWVLMCNADGYTSPLVLIVTVNTMPEGKFFVHKTQGLSEKQAFRSAGWIYFCNSRAGNAALWQHWFLHVVLPTLSEAQAYFGEEDGSGAPLRMVFSTDGEAIIMKEAFSPEVLAGFKAALIDYLKGGPSVSSHHQACDVGPMFRDVKCGVKYHTQACTDTTDRFLRRNLKDLFAQFTVEFPSIVLPDGFQSRLISACEIIVYVMKSKYFTCTKVQTGFEECGQHVRNSKVGESTVSYDRIMSRTLAKDLQQAKEDEKARKSALTPLQKREELMAKKVKSAAAAEKKQQGKAATIAAAKVVLNVT